jgi:8-oxo-dGTP diphosphatase
MPITGPDPGCLQAESRTSDTPLPLVLVVAVALIDIDGRVLLAQRPEGKHLAGLWEFPGGKVHEGETPEAAVVRELREELAVDITESCLAPFAFASHPYDDFQLLMPLYVCRVWKGTPTPLEGQALRWVRPLAMASLPMPPADAPLVAMLRDYL